MAWEWVAPVATASVGVCGIVFTWLTGSQGRSHAQVLAKQQQDHAERAAATARTQQRKAEAYVQVLEVVEQIGNWSQNLKPALDTDPPRELPPLAEYSHQISSKARLLAFGSPEVQALWQTWHKEISQIRVAAVRIARAERSVSVQAQIGIDERWGNLEDHLRPAEFFARKALSDKMHDELGLS